MKTEQSTQPNLPYSTEELLNLRCDRNSSIIGPTGVIAGNMPFTTALFTAAFLFVKKVPFNFIDLETGNTLINFFDPTKGIYIKDPLIELLFSQSQDLVLQIDSLAKKQGIVEAKQLYLSGQLEMGEGSSSSAAESKPSSSNSEKSEDKGNTETEAIQETK